MPKQTKLERILDMLVNEETAKAEELLHDLVVSKARNIYESLVNEMDFGQEEEDEDEGFGGSMKDDFIGDVEADEDDITSDEEMDGEVEGDYDEMGDDMGMDMEGAEPDLADINAQIEQLSADLQSYLDADDMGDEEAYDDGMDMGDEESIEDEGEEGFMGDYADDDDVEEGYYSENIDEATKLQDPVADPGMTTEKGKLAGTGKHSKTGATGKESPYTNAPTKSLEGADPVDFTKGGDEKGGKGDSASDDTPSSNIGEEPKNVSHGEQKTEGEFAGTGKNSKKGKVNTKSPLSTAPKKP